MAEKARILVADDEPHIRRILQFLLENEGFEVYLAEDGSQAWEAVRTFQPDLVQFLLHYKSMITSIIFPTSCLLM